MILPEHIIIETEAAMETLGAELAAKCKAGQCITLQGQLGAGKSTLVRGFLKSLGHKGTVKSPTYTLVETYVIAAKTGVQINHFDLYRLSHPEELEFIGWRDYFNSQSINLIEWPEKAGDMLPRVQLSISIEILADNKRQVSLCYDVTLR